MTPLPNFLSISLWVIGSCWAVAAIAYLTDSATDALALLVIIGALTGLAEWLMRRQRH